jgi:hypothetical protein
MQLEANPRIRQSVDRHRTVMLFKDALQVQAILPIAAAGHQRALPIRICAVH